MLAALGMAVTCLNGMAATDLIPRPGAMQPGGDANDTSPLHWGKWWGDLGTVEMAFDTTRSSSNNIAGSIHVTFDCLGGPAWNPADPKSANLAFGNFLESKWGDNGWLGAGNEFDASKYESLNMDVYVDTTVSSNTVIPVYLFGSGYQNNWLADIAITNSGWQHLVIPISPTINLPNCSAYGVYDWYNTVASTPPAHVEYWFDNVKLVARQLPPPPPTLSAKALPHSGLLFDCGVGEGGARGSIDTIGDVRWIGLASSAAPITYSMTVGWVPDPKVYSNYEANIFIAPTAGVGNPDWNLSDVGWLQIHSQNDGTAFAQMLWKTNSPFNNDMFWNTQFGGEYGTNGYAAGLLCQFVAPTMVGTWSISFTSDTDLTVRGPGGVSTNLTLPAAWIDSYNAAGGAGHAYFGGSPNGNNNAGQPMFLDNVAVKGGALQLNLSNDFSSLPLDTATWGLLGNQTFVVPSKDTWWLSWTLPAVNFDLFSTANLSSSNQWTQLTGNTNLPVPVATYTSGTNSKALVAVADLSNASRSFFTLKKLVVAKLQVLMPGETNAPGTATGKIGTPTQQQAGFPVTVTVNAVDANWNIVGYCTDNVSITSSDQYATDDNNAQLPLTGALTAGTRTFNIIFATQGSQTITATDTTQTTVTAGTGSATAIVP